MKILSTVFIPLFFCLVSAEAFAQSLSLSGKLGYASPQGDAFRDADTGERLTSFGLGYDVDILYHLESFDSRLGLGLMYVGSALFGSESATRLDVGIYGLDMFGVKGQYRLSSPDNGASPFFGLGLGLSRFATPDITIFSDNGNIFLEGKRTYGIGIRPEIGMDLGRFLVSTAYLVPMKYTIESDAGNFEGTAGSLTFSIGYRLNVDLSGFF